MMDETGGKEELLWSARDPLNTQWIGVISASIDIRPFRTRDILNCARADISLRTQ